MKTLFAVSAAVTFVAGIVGTHVISKKVGKKEAINMLRVEQLEQSFEEYKARKELDFKGSFAELQTRNEEIETWYEAETTEINAMYDEIVNNL